jgi:hypothetical protein
MMNWGLLGLGLGYLAGQVIVAVIAGILMWRMMVQEHLDTPDSPG